VSARILVTGSRKWDDATAIKNALLAASSDVGWDTFDPLGGPVVVQGGAFGADLTAAIEAVRQGMHVQTYRAIWTAACLERCSHGPRRRLDVDVDYCPAAGVYRNELMVSHGAALCLAFIKNKSSGATRCAALAEAAGIPVRYWKA